MTRRWNSERSNRTLGTHDETSGAEWEPAVPDYDDELANGFFENADVGPEYVSQFEDPMLDQIKTLTDFLEDAERRLYVNLDIHAASERRNKT
ncbi:MAG: hypothetical protein ACKVP2_10565 [Burkholderiales bacterium]